MIFQKSGYHDGCQHDRHGLLIIPACKRIPFDFGRRPENEDAAIEKTNKERFPLDIASIAQTKKMKETKL
jgi:hypothetical protein